MSADSIFLDCECGHPAADHYDDGNGGHAECDHEGCDCTHYRAEVDEPMDDATRYAVLGDM